MMHTMIHFNAQTLLKYYPYWVDVLSHIHMPFMGQEERTIINCPGTRSFGYVLISPVWVFNNNHCGDCTFAKAIYMHQSFFPELIFQQYYRFRRKNFDTTNHLVFYKD